MPPFPRGLVFPATATVTLPKLAPQEFYALAREVAMQINELPDILRAHALTELQYERIRESGTFNRILEIEIQQWASAKNTPERVRIEAAATFEQLIPKLYARAVDMKENFNHVVEASKLLAKVGNVDQSERQIDPTEKFIINIDLGGERISLTHSAAPLNADGSIAKPSIAITEAPKG